MGTKPKHPGTGNPPAPTSIPHHNPAEIRKSLFTDRFPFQDSLDSMSHFLTLKNRLDLFSLLHLYFNTLKCGF